MIEGNYWFKIFEGDTRSYSLPIRLHILVPYVVASRVFEYSLSYFRLLIYYLMTIM